MPKRKNRLNTLRESSTLEKVPDSPKTGNAKFNFLNGDIYEGEFVIQNGKTLFKQGYGKYKTDNFDVYSAQWYEDNVANDLQIQYNNGMKYNGEINAEGEMTNFGTFIFPDQSSIEANWKKNYPFSNLNFVEPSGFKWNGIQSDAKKEVLFEPENHFWKEIYCDLNEMEKNASSHEIDEFDLKNKTSTVFEK